MPRIAPTMPAGERSGSFIGAGFGVLASMKVHTAVRGGLSQRFSLELTLNKKNPDIIGKSTYKN